METKNGEMEAKWRQKRCKMEAKNGCEMSKWVKWRRKMVKWRRNGGEKWCKMETKSGEMEAMQNGGEKWRQNVKMGQKELKYKILIIIFFFNKIFLIEM